MARTIVATRTELINWIDAHTTDASADDLRAIADRIQGADHPRWGGDWTAFLAALPENLYELLPAKMEG